MKFCMFERAFKKKGRMLLALAALFFVFAEAGPASAKSVLWQGGTSSDWNTDSNWVWDGGVPGPGDSANIGSNTEVVSPVIGAGASGVTGYLVVGGGYTGALHIAGSLTSATALIGNDQASKLAVGTVTVAGSSASWTNTGDLYVGNYSAGELNVQNGAHVSANLVNMGAEVGSSGTVNLTGSGSALNLAANLFVGYGGSGTLNVGSGTAVTSVGGVLGNNAGGSGTATINGGSWNTGAGTILIGGNGQGDLTIQNGGTLTSTGGTVGWGGTAATTSTATVTGTGSNWTSSDSLYVGNNATGILNIQNGGAVSTTQSLFVGSNSGSNGTVNLTGSGSSLNVTQGLYVGYQGTGALNVGAGTTVNTGTLNVGHSANGNGTVTVSGAGAALTATNGAFFGYGTNAAASLTVSSGGSFETVSEGFYLKSGSTMTVSGTGTTVNIGSENSGVPSTWSDSDGWLYLGNSTVTVSAGANVTTDGLYVSGETGGDATMTVTGASTVLDGKLCIYVGGDSNGSGTTGNGTLTIADGATASASVIATGNDPNTTGTILVTGAGSSLSSVYNNATFTGKVYAGYEGNGIITVQNGASLSAADVIRIAWVSGSTGTLNIGAAEGQAATAAGAVTATNGVVFGDGTGTVVFNHTDSNYTFAPAISGNGAVKVLAGTTVFTGASTYSGATTITEGTLRAGAANTFSGNSAVAVGATGTLDLNNYDQTIGGLSGSGTVALGSGILTVNSAADSAFSGTISGTGGLTKDGTGVLTLSGNSDYSGATTINGGTLRAGAVNVFSENSIVTVNANGTLDLNNYDQTIVDLSGTGTVLLGSATLTVTNNTAVNDFTLTGTGGVTKTGTGTLTLSGSNSDYSGETAVTAGTLQAGATNAFSPNSTVSVSASGTLDLNSYDQAIGGLTGSGTVTLGSATLSVGNTADNTFSGTISGTGGLTKTGSGALILTGDNTYTGATAVQQGTLSLSGSSASSSMAVSSGAILDFSPSRDLAYAGVISGDGAVTKTGNNTLTLTGTNTYTGGTTISAGTLAISSDANLGASTGALALSGGTLQTTAALTTSRNITVTGSGAIDNTGNAFTLSGNLLGSGNLSLTGSGTDTLDATFNGSGYTGTLTRSDGVLHLVSGGTLGGTLAIADGATLNGVGTVANLTVSGNVSPGNSPGTLTVTGDYVQGASGVYVCEVSPTANDLIAVTGSATLSGTISIVPEYTYYNSGTVWNVLTATGGVSGTYSTVTYGATPENWVFVPIYSANAVTVVLERQSYSNSATSSQASSVGSGLDAAAYSATGEMATLIKSLDYSYGTNAMYSATNALTDYTLNVLSPEIYATFSQNVFEAGRMLTGAQRAGLHEGEGNAGAGFASPLDFGPATLAAQNTQDGGIPAGIPGANAGSVSQTLSLGRFGIFLKPLGMRASQQGGSEQTGYVTLAGGITGGILYRPSAELTLGLAPGYVNQSITLHSEGGGQGTINDWSLALLAAYRHGSFYADAGLRGAYNTFSSSRALPLPNGKYTAKGNWDGWNMNVSVGGGYDFTAGDFTYGPLASVSWQRLHENGFREKGAGTLGQSIRARDTHALNTVLGAHVSRTFETSVGDVTPEVRAAWSSQWLGDSQNIVATFIGSPSSTYQAKTKDQHYNSALVDLGVTVGLSGSLAATARVGVELFRPGYAAQAASVGIKYAF